MRSWFRHRRSGPLSEDTVAVGATQGKAITAVRESEWPEDTGARVALDKANRAVSKRDWAAVREARPHVWYGGVSLDPWGLHGVLMPMTYSLGPTSLVQFL